MQMVKRRKDTSTTAALGCVFDYEPGGLIRIAQCRRVALIGISSLVTGAVTGLCQFPNRDEIATEAVKLTMDTAGTSFDGKLVARNAPASI